MGAHANLLAKLKLILILMLLFVGPLSAQAQDIKSSVLSLSQSAMADYDDFELEAADEKLMQATQLIESSTTSDPAFANVYVAQAVVSHGRFKDTAPAIAEDRAFSALLKALSYNSDVDIPADYRSGELENLLNKARKVYATSGSAVVLNTTKPVIDHTPLYEQQRCQAAEIRARVPAHPNIYRVVVHYAPDTEQYKDIEMHPSGESADILVAEVPGLATQGNELLYYIEGINRSGEVVVTSATAADPNHVIMIGACGGLSTSDLATKYGEPLFQMTVGVGTGLMFASEAESYCTKNTCYRKNDIAQPFNTAGVNGPGILPVHLKISAMFNLPAHIQLGLQIRGQLANTQNTSEITKEYLGPWDALSMGVEFRYFPLYKQPYRLYVGLAAGGGGANATFILSNQGNYRDLYKFGYGYIAPEVGFLLTLHRYVGLAFELAMPFHFPQNPNVHFDLSVGPFVQF